MVGAERHEVRLPGRVESFQFQGIRPDYAREATPLKPKNGLSGPPSDGFRFGFEVSESILAGTPTADSSLYSE